MSCSRRPPTATVYRSTEAAARGTGPIGEVVIAGAPVSVGDAAQIVAVGGCRFCAGLRSDPFFLDADGLRNGFQFTGHDTFANRNVFGMVLEVPHAALGSAGPLRLWSRPWLPCMATWPDRFSRAPRNHNRLQSDGRRSGGVQRGGTDDQRERFGARFIATFRAMGYPEAAGAPDRRFTRRASMPAPT